MRNKVKRGGSGVEDDQKQPSRPFWLREDRELIVAAHERQTQEGEQEIGSYLRTITVSAHKVRVNWQARGGPGGVPSTASGRR